MILRWRCSATRKACGLELTRAVWPGVKDLGIYSVVEASLGILKHILKYNSLWPIDKFY